jgi:hypothetical protein
MRYNDFYFFSLSSRNRAKMHSPAPPRRFPVGRSASLAGFSSQPYVAITVARLAAIVRLQLVWTFPARETREANGSSDTKIIRRAQHAAPLAGETRAAFLLPGGDSAKIQRGILQVRAILAAQF